MSTNYNHLLNDVQAIAKKAAAKILQVYDGHFCVESKADNSPVTEADLGANAIIETALKKLTPDWPVLSEEGQLPPYEERKQWSRYWLVDPLDGTREFIRCSGDFTVNIALIENHQAVLGMIYVPVGGISYFATQGSKAYKQMNLGPAEEISVSPWDGGYITIAGSRAPYTPTFNHFLANFDDCHVLRLGSSLKSCYVAEGKADVYARFGPTSEWDTAAAQCILEAAGGQLMDLALKPLRYNTKESILNPSFFAVGDARHRWDKMAPKDYPQD